MSCRSSATHPPPVSPCSSLEGRVQGHKGDFGSSGQSFQLRENGGLQMMFASKMDNQNIQKWKLADKIIGKY